MRRQRSWKQYRRIDLALFALMQVIFEFIIVAAASFWFPDQPFTVSLAAPLTSIVYMRWGWWGGIHAVLSGLVFCFYQGASPVQYMIYMAGNLLSVISVLFLNLVGKEKVRTGAAGLFYPILVLLLMQTGRSVTALLVGAELGKIPGFFTTDSLSMLFTVVIIWIARRLDGVYEDQIHYLLRINAEEEL